MGVTIPQEFSWEHMGLYSGQGPSAKDIFDSIVTDLNALQAATIATAAVTDTAGGAYTATEQGMLNDLKALTTEMRTAINTVAAVTIGTAMA